MGGFASRVAGFLTLVLIVAVGPVTAGLGAETGLGAENPVAPLRLARVAGVPDQMVASQILAVVYDRLHIPVSFVDLPGPRALILTSTGALDGEVARNADVAADYPALIRVEPAINTVEPTAFSKSARIPITGWESLRPYRIGVVRNLGISERETAGMPGVVAGTTLESLFSMLDLDRLDIVVIDRFSGLLALHRMKLDGRIQALQPPLVTIDVYHYLNARHRDLVPRVAAVLRAMRQSGELDRLAQDFEQKIIDQSGD